MRYLYLLPTSLAALLLQLTGQAASPIGRHARSSRSSSLPTSGSGVSTQRSSARSARSRPYAPQPEPVPASEPRIPNRDAFYELAELSRHASRWHFTYDDAASKAPYTATHCAEHSLSVAASTVEGLENLLDDITVPDPVRRYYRLAHQQRPDAAKERAELDLLARADR